MIVVYTAIAGDSPDKLQPVKAAVREPNTQFVCFGNIGPVEGWDIRPPQWQHAGENGRRTSRWHKLHSHALFPEATYSIWHDANFQLRVPPSHLIEGVLDVGHSGCTDRQWYDVATFKHPVRNCLFQELLACMQLKKDDSAVMREHVDRYRRLGMPRHYGLYETGCVVRRHDNISVDCMNERWWMELRDGSLRDQLSFPYVLWSLGMEVPSLALLRGSGMDNPYFDVKSHW